MQVGIRKKPIFFGEKVGGWGRIQEGRYKRKLQEEDTSVTADTELFFFSFKGI